MNKMNNGFKIFVGIIFAAILSMGYVLCTMTFTAPSVALAKYKGLDTRYVAPIYFNEYKCQDCVFVTIDKYYEYTLAGYILKTNSLDLSVSQIYAR